MIDFDFQIAVRQLMKSHPVDTVKLISLFMKSELAKDFDRGMLSDEEFFAAILKEVSLPVPKNEFIRLWNEIFTEKDDMVRLAKDLKKRFKVGILSNTNPWHVSHLRKKHGWIFDFDFFVASCEVRLMKPDPKIYLLTLEKAGIRPEETFYLDDISENVEAAKKLGIDAVQFIDASGAILEIRKRNLLPA